MTEEEAREWLWKDLLKKKRPEEHIEEAMKVAYDLGWAAHAEWVSGVTDDA